jgi:RNA polymerase sigma-70 factor (ECF subfamily)
LDPRASAHRRPPDEEPGSDAELVRGALRGEEAAIELLVERLRCVPRILSAINRRHGGLLDAHDLADLAQDTIVLVWRKLGSFQAPGTLDTWAYGIALRECMNALRRKLRPTARTDSAAGGAAFEIAAPPVADPLEHAELGDFLAELAPEEQAVIRLKHEDGLTFEEIGLRLGIPPNTAKTRHYRGLRTLEARLTAAWREGRRARR